MKNRKRGFSLVELLIVLAVIAALIATITPVALNAIRKSKATQVAQNLKTLASAIENAAYVNGVFPADHDDYPGKIRNALNDKPIELKDLGRDINAKEYGVYYGGASGSYTAVVAFIGEAEIELVDDVLAQATETSSFAANLVGTTTPITVEGTEIPEDYSANAIYYRISFDVY